MTGEQEKELTDYLASLGFSGEKFITQLQDKLKLNTPNFAVPARVSFGEEQMFFNLHFVKDTQFNAYRLQRYHALHRSPVMIEHMIINGIDTAALEERMKGQDWQTYFDKQTEATDVAAIKDMRETTEMLNKLSEGQDFDGIQIQEELMYKYWPADSYYSDGKSDFKIYHERSRDFSPNEYGMCNTNLAYHIVSGRLDDLHEKLSTAAIDQYSGKDVYTELERFLSDNPDSFELKFSRNEPEGFSELVLPVNKTDEDYHAENYAVTLIPYPPVEYGIYNGIDSKKLEDMMREINWHDDRQLFIFRENAEPEFPQRINDVQEQIYRMSQDAVGAKVADQLQLKYWVDATFFEDMIGQEAWDHLKELPKKERNFPIETEAKAAYNLLCGRSAMQKNLDDLSPETPQWTRLNFTTLIPGWNYKLDVVPGFSMTELENVLDVFPIPNSGYYPVRNGLIRGDLVPVKLANDKKVLMEANPEQRTVNVYTPDMRLIPTNVHLDPDWKPSVGKEERINQTQQKRPIPADKYPTVKRSQKRKGRGL